MKLIKVLFGICLIFYSQVNYADVIRFCGTGIISSDCILNGTPDDTASLEATIAVVLIPWGSGSTAVKDTVIDGINTDVFENAPVGSAFLRKRTRYKVITASGTDGAPFVVVERICRPDAIHDPNNTSGNLTCIFASCPEGTERDEEVGLCLPPEPDLPKNNADPCPYCQPTPNPIHPGTGNKYQIETDYSGTGAYPLTLQRYYNSLVPTNGNLGSHWRSSYSQSLSIDPNNTEVTAKRSDAKEYTYTLTGSNWVPDPDVVEQLVEIVDGSSVRIGWEYITSNDTVETYSADGKLLSLTRRDGLTQTLAYDIDSANGGDDNPDTLDKVTDPAGRTLTFSYDANARVATITDPAGGVYSYTYDTGDNLVTVTYPDETPGDANDNPQRLYHYEDPNFPHALTGITDENGNRFATYAYDSQGRAILSEHAGGAIRVDVVYNTDGTTTVTDSRGTVQTLHFEVQHGVVKLTAQDGEPCADCGQYVNTTYDANGFIASRTDFNGTVTTFVNDARGLETSRTEAVGTPQERTITTEWHPTFRLPVQITEPGQMTTFTYDTAGRLLTREVTTP